MSDFQYAPPSDRTIRENTSASISRRAFLRAGAFGVTGLAAGCLNASRLGHAADSRHAGRPNILLLMTDQHRFDALSSYGCRAVTTPNLDRLAQEGALFERCYSPNPICTPVRASLLTGKHVPGHGVYKLHDLLPKEEILLPERLKAVGYETTLVGKLHVSGLWEEADRRHPHDGFEHYHWCIDPGLNFDSPFNAYARWVRSKDPAFYERLKREGKSMHHFPAALHFSTWAAETTIERVRGRDSDRPFFILMSLFDPHDPYYDHPLEAADAVDVEAIPAPQAAQDDPALPDGVRREYEKSQDILKHMPEYANDIPKLRKGYYASIAFLDAQIGRVLDCLDELALTDETLVIFVSDHGDMLFDRGLFSKGGYFYDPSVRVPLLMRWPGHIPAGCRIPELVQHMDITATLLVASGHGPDQCHATWPHSMDLLALIREGAAYERNRNWAVCVFRNTGYGPGGMYFDPPIHATMFRDDRYKLNVYHGHSGDGGAIQGELFDMHNDPTESLNLWCDPNHAEVKATLLQRLLNWSVSNEVQFLGSRGGETFRSSVMKAYGAKNQ